MKTEDYKPSVTTAYVALKGAIATAMALLPMAVRTQYHIASTHAPDPWENVERAYEVFPEAKEEILELIGHIKLLSRAARSLHAVLQAKPQCPPNLKLATVRRLQ